MDNNFATSDLGLAAYIMFKGGSLEGYGVAHENGKDRMEFRFTQVLTEWIAAYRRDDEGIQGYLGARRTLLRIVKTEMQ